MCGPCAFVFMEVVFYCSFLLSMLQFWCVFDFAIITSLANYSCVFDGFTPSYSLTHNGDDAPQNYRCASNWSSGCKHQDVHRDLCGERPMETICVRTVCFSICMGGGAYFS